MNKYSEEKKTKKYLRKVKSKWVVAAASAVALIGVGGVYASESETAAEVRANESVHSPEKENEVVTVPLWQANRVNEVKEEIELQEFKDASSYQIQWGDTLWALSRVTGFNK